MRPRVLYLGSILGVFLLLGAFLLRGQKKKAPDTADTWQQLARQMSLFIPQSPMRAPSFELKEIGGGKRTLASYKGRVLLLNFLTSW